MDLKEMYIEIGGSYEDVSSRLPSDALIQRFVLKFLDDKSYAQLCDAMNNDAEEAFRAAHTLKGVCQNLGFERLGALASELTELLRGGEFPTDNSVLTELKESYGKTITAIKKIK